MMGAGDITERHIRHLREVADQWHIDHPGEPFPISPALAVALCDRLDGPRRSAAEWLATPTYRYVTILDPDGWDRSAPDWAAEWATPLTREGFEARLALSTIGPAIPQGLLERLAAAERVVWWANGLCECAQVLYDAGGERYTLSDIREAVAAWKQIREGRSKDAEERSHMTTDDMVGAVRTFLDFLGMAEYPHPVQLTALQDADSGVCSPLDKASIDDVLTDFAEWLQDD